MKKKLTILIFYTYLKLQITHSSLLNFLKMSFLIVFKNISNKSKFSNFVNCNYIILILPNIEIFILVMIKFVHLN